MFRKHIKGIAGSVEDTESSSSKYRQEKSNVNTEDEIDLKTDSDEEDIERAMQSFLRKRRQRKYSSHKTKEKALVSEVNQHEKQISSSATPIQILATQLVLDYDDVMKIPVLNDYIRQKNKEGIRLRTDMNGEVANQDIYFPGLLPKVPGRLYYLFGKPIRTEGQEKMLKNRENAKELYMQIKYEVEKSMAYLIKKREEDPYRGVVDRVINQPFSTPVHQVPTFEP